MKQNSIQLIFLALLNMVPSTLLDFDWLKLIRHMHEIFSIIGRIQTDPNINLPEIKVLLPQEPWLMMRSLFWRPDSEIFCSKLQIYSNPAVDVKEETEKGQHVIFLVKIDQGFGIMEKVIINNIIAFKKCDRFILAKFKSHSPITRSLRKPVSTGSRIRTILIIAYFY